MKFWGGERVRFTKNVTNTMTSISNVGYYTYTYTYTIVEILLCILLYESAQTKLNSLIQTQHICSSRIRI